MNKLIIVFSLLVLFSIPRRLYAQVGGEKDTVRVGYSKNLFSSVNIEDAKAATNFLLEKIIKEWGKVTIQSIAKIYDDPNQIKSDVDNNLLDLVVLNTTEYLELRGTQKITPFSVYIYGDAILSKMMLLVKVGYEINSIKALRNKKICISKTFNSDRNLTTLWLQTLILQNKEDYTKYYAPYISYYDKALRCVADLLLGKVDAVIISEQEYNAVKDLNPQFSTQFKIAFSSKPLLYSVFCYTNRIKIHKTFTLEELKDRLSRIQNSKTGRQFLSIFRIDSFTPYKPEFLKDTEELIYNYNKLTKGKKLY